MIVDAHHHFWDPTRADYPWLTDDIASIRRPFGPSDLAPLLEGAGIEATVLVQTRSSEDESREFLATAATIPFIRGVVGWVDLTDPAVEDRLAAMRDAAGGERLVGIRHQVHDEADPRWLLRADVMAGIAAVGSAGLAYDLLVRTRELAAARTLVAALPHVRFVVDHLAKPPIRVGDLGEWSAGVAAFRGLSNVWWKLSGLVTEADWTAWRPADLRPMVDHVLEVAGPDRMLFGSDLAVCLLAAGYPQGVGAPRQLTAGVGDVGGAAIFGESAPAV